MSEGISAAISVAIVNIRDRIGLTRDELAAAARLAGAPAGFTAPALRNIESGRRAVSVDELVWLAAALAVSVRDLLGEYAGLFGAELKPPPAFGAVEEAARRAVEELDGLTGAEQPLVEGAFVLAKALDDGAGMATAAVHKEFRAALAAIWEGRADDEDEDADDLGPS
jgi:transcriptional regulator with XRE-family HTH domain